MVERSCLPWPSYGSRRPRQSSPARSTQSSLNPSEALRVLHKRWPDNLGAHWWRIYEETSVDEQSASISASDISDTLERFVFESKCVPRPGSPLSIFRVPFLPCRSVTRNAPPLTGVFAVLPFQSWEPANPFRSVLQSRALANSLLSNHLTLMLRDIEM